MKSWRTKTQKTQSLVKQIEIVFERQGRKVKNSIYNREKDGFSRKMVVLGVVCGVCDMGQRASCRMSKIEMSKIDECVLLEDKNEFLKYFALGSFLITFQLDIRLHFLIRHSCHLSNNNLEAIPVIKPPPTPLYGT